jgi:hypothetical protein
VQGAQLINRPFALKAQQVEYVDLLAVGRMFSNGGLPRLAGPVPSPGSTRDAQISGMLRTSV